MNKIVIISGATATGKSDIAVELAKILNTEIISADSMQIYRDLNIGTAKITEDEMKNVKHHMIDVVESYENFSVSDYRKKSIEIINNLHKINKIPIIVGGTGLYIHSLIYDMDFCEQKSDDKLREKLNEIYKTEGCDKLYDYLYKLSPEIANKIHKNNVKKVIRNIEILSQNKEIQDFSNTDKSKFIYDVKLFVLNDNRENLYNKINLRVDKMFELGLEKEIDYLKSIGLKKENQSMKGIGYREFFEYDNLEIIKDKIKQNSRHYAKRQITWFKRYDFAIKLDIFNKTKSEIIDSIVEQII